MQVLDPIDVVKLVHQIYPAYSPKCKPGVLKRICRRPPNSCQRTGRKPTRQRTVPDRPVAAIASGSKYDLCSPERSECAGDLPRCHARNVGADHQNRPRRHPGKDSHQAFSEISLTLRNGPDPRQPGPPGNRGIGRSGYNEFPSTITSKPTKHAVQIVPVPPDRRHGANISRQPRLYSPRLRLSCHEYQEVPPTSAQLATHQTRPLRVYSRARRSGETPAK